MRTLAVGLMLILQLSGAGIVAAQELQLNGIGSFEQLRKEYYIGGLYLPTLTSDPVIIEAMDGPKRLELRITAERWTQRRFAQWCNQSVPINNGPAALGQHADDLLALTNVIKDDLINGDILVVEQAANQNTRVKLNGVTLLQTNNSGLFNLVLNTWIGAVPPSSGFKQGILQLPTDAAGTALLTRYEAVAPSNERKADVAKWPSGSDTATAAAPAAEEERNVVALPPPGGDTVVRAKPTEVAKASPSREAVASQQTQPAVAAPDIKVDKPSLASSEPTKAPAPAAAPKPAPAPAPAPKPAPAAAAAAPVAAAVAAKPESNVDEEEEQDGLLMAYRSNVMKLTYLNTQYPKRALDLKQEGLVVIKLTLSRNGKILDLTFLEEAKYGALNSAAERAIKRSAPYPEAPNSLKGETIEMELPFNFKL